MSQEQKQEKNKKWSDQYLNLMSKKKYDAEIKKFRETYDAEMKKFNGGKEKRKETMMIYTQYRKYCDERLSITFDPELKEKYCGLFTAIKEVTIPKRHVLIHTPFNATCDHKADTFPIQYYYEIKVEMYKNGKKHIFMNYSGNIIFFVNLKTNVSSFVSFDLTGDNTTFSTNKYNNALNYLKHLTLLDANE